MHGVCWNENSELLRLLLEAKLVDQDMLKIPNKKVRIFILCNTESGNNQK